MGDGILFGLGFAAVAIGVSWLLGGDRGCAVLALLLAAAAAVYVGATLGDQPGSGGVATAAFVFFGALALWGLDDARLLGFGWALHAVWDLLHVLGLLASGAPEWYEIGCLVADPLIAAYLFLWAAPSPRKSLQPTRHLAKRSSPGPGDHRGGILILVLLTGCSGITVPAEPASQEGVVVERDRPTSFERQRPTIWVKDALEDECGVIYVIARGTDLFTRDASGRVREIGVDDLKVGSAVRVWTDLRKDSCPGQATAEAVELVDRD